MDEGTLRNIYRKALERYSKAQGSPEWTEASLKSMDELTHLTAGRAASREAALETLLLGNDEEIAVRLGAELVTINPVAHRQKAFRRVLELQKAPSLDALFAIREALSELPGNPRGVEAIQKQLQTFVTLTPQKAWKSEGLEKKCLERYETLEANKSVVKLREKLAKNKHNPADVAKIAAELLGELEPWVQLAMTGQVYARYLDPSDLIVSEDSMLLRKHEFVELGPAVKKNSFWSASLFNPSSEGEGSFFVGGLAEFSLAAGNARASGNHLGGPNGEAISAALLGSIRATDWRPLTAPALQAFAARVRLAREWVVESAVSPPMRIDLEQQSLGLLSLTRRAKLIDGIVNRDWLGIWESISLTDLYFLGDSLLDHSSAQLWKSPSLMAMKRAAGSSGHIDGLGQVAPHLSGCMEPRLRRYEPYEEYQRYFHPDRIAERVAELKVYLAWVADSQAWPPQAIGAVAPSAADAVLSKLHLGDSRDWGSALEAYRGLKVDTLEFLLSKQ